MSTTMANPYERFVLALARTRVGVKVMRPLAERIDRQLIRWTGGRITSGIGTKHGKSICLLAAVGAKSGERRTVPVLFTRHGDALILVGSKGGEPKNPSWVYNLRANPGCEVTVRGEIRSYVAREVEGEERAAIWEVALANYPGYALYQERVERTIPVFLLEPA